MHVGAFDFRPIPLRGRVVDHQQQTFGQGQRPQQECDQLRGNRFALASHAGQEVIIVLKIVADTRGAKPCVFRSFRISFNAAALLRFDWIKKSKTSPSLSTARHRYIRLPRIETNISSRCHRSLGLGLHLRIRWAYRRPNFRTHRRIVSLETSIPRSASSSSTSR